MAKRYIKIGWENKPSVKTPVNMANLGRMDKGIDDCDNAIEEIYSKRVNNVVTTNEDTFLAGPVGKVLQDQVTELNKNLYDLKTTRGYANTDGLIVSSPATVNDLKETGIYKVNSTTPDMPADTGEYTAILEVFKASTAVVFQRATTVWVMATAKPLGTVYTRVCYDSDYTPWVAK